MEFLRDRFEKAMVLQSGLQQPDRAESPSQHEALASARREDIAELEDAVRDLVAALLGREIVLGKGADHPWDEAALRAFWAGQGKPLDLEGAIKQHEVEIEALKVKQRRADDLWKRVVAPLSAEDRKLLLALLGGS